MSLSYRYTQWELNKYLLNEDLEDVKKDIPFCHCLPLDTKNAFVWMEVEGTLYGLRLRSSIRIAS